MKYLSYIIQYFDNVLQIDRGTTLVDEDCDIFRRSVSSGGGWRSC